MAKIPKPVEANKTLRNNVAPEPDNTIHSDLLPITLSRFVASAKTQALAALNQAIVGYSAENEKFNNSAPNSYAHVAQMYHLRIYNTEAQAVYEVSAQTPAAVLAAIENADDATLKEAQKKGGIRIEATIDCKIFKDRATTLHSDIAATRIKHEPKLLAGFAEAEDVRAQASAHVVR